MIRANISFMLPASFFLLYKLGIFPPNNCSGPAAELRAKKQLLQNQGKLFNKLFPNDSILGPQLVDELLFQGERFNLGIPILGRTIAGDLFY
jgi:hypothetical protein